MKKALLIALLLLPATSFAQIYPLQEYAKTSRDSGQELKFLRSPSDVTYVATCKGEGDRKMCDLAKNGRYKTKTGLSFVVRDWQLRSAEDASVRCDYNERESTLECKD